jgi:hypothetical protein
LPFSFSSFSFFLHPGSGRVPGIQHTLGRTDHTLRAGSYRLCGMDV